MESLTNTFSVASQKQSFDLFVWFVLLLILDDAGRNEKRCSRKRARHLLIEEQKKPVPVPKIYGHVTPF